MASADSVRNTDYDADPLPDPNATNFVRHFMLDPGKAN